jgi:hypothetical protein
MSISLKVTDSIQDIQKNVDSALVELINDHITKNLNKIFIAIKVLIPSWIRVQPEIISLLSTEPTSLAGQFGINRNADVIVNNIINAIVGATEIKFTKYTKKFNGGLEINFQPKNFQNLLSLADGHTVYTDGDLHWLDWLLKRGDSIIIMNYQYNPQTGLGRSGLGNMISGGAFRVPPQFSGTIDDNFVTRAFLGKDQEQQVFTILEKILS